MPVESASLDGPAREALDSEWSAISAEFPEAQRPEVDLERYVAPNEVSQVLVECMNDEGYPDVKLTADGALDSGFIPTAQRESFLIELYSCGVRYQLDPKYYQPLDEAQLSRLYEYFSNELKPCLEAEGYPVPDAPSEQAFVENYEDNGGWLPYSLVRPTTEEKWIEINRSCPQIPSDLYG